MATRREARAVRVAEAAKVFNPILPKSYEKTKDPRASGALLGIYIGNLVKAPEKKLSPDGEMSYLLFNTLLTHLQYFRKTVGMEYIRWANPGRLLSPGARNALTNARDYDDACKKAYKMNFGYMDCSALVRILPMAVFCELSKIESKLMLMWSKEDCLITHPATTMVEAVKLYVIAIRAAIIGIHADDIINIIERLAVDPIVKQIIIDSGERPGPAMLRPGIYSDDETGLNYVGTAIQNALYELQHGISFESSLRDIMDRGGNMVDNCTIAGALLGAYYGDTNIPAHWIKLVDDYDSGNLRRLVTKLCYIEKKK